MNNLFSFEYQVNNIANQDGTESRFFSVLGEGGKVMHCKKDSYHLVQTSDLSAIGNAFIERGNDVSTFTHRDGEVIGLNISLGAKMTKVGDMMYQALITVPNNGGGRGKLSIKQKRLICLNGSTRELYNKDQSIKIPHNAGYNDYLKLMEEAIIQFGNIIEYAEEHDTQMDGQKLTNLEITYHLNKWFFEEEMPPTHKVDNMTFDQFRKLLATDPESIKSYDRYQELKKALTKELEYNIELSLESSMYTVYAAVTNYISRRIEKSQSKASEEVQLTRESEKLKYFSLV